VATAVAPVAATTLAAVIPAAAAAAVVTPPTAAVATPAVPTHSRPDETMLEVGGIICESDGCLSIYLSIHLDKRDR
jgi:hypothetical protein